MYLNMPVWCFALGAGICGESVWAGVLMPGVDRVGRYFPFTIAAPVAVGDAAAWLGGAQSWYDEATRRALSTLADDFVLKRFDMELDAWGPLHVAPSARVAWRLGLGGQAQQQAGPALGENDGSDVEQPGAVRDGFADALADHAAAGSSAWWTEGSSAVPPALLGGPGLPDGERFVGLLGEAPNGWQSIVKLRR
jgi:type VI secretion system protein ImpM